MEEIDTSYLHARKLLVPMFESVKIVMVGCGGTGSWLAPAIVRIGKLLVEQGKQVWIAFCDHDQVEEKNIYRQNFCAAEIGRNKAETLAFRYGGAWGMSVNAVSTRFEADSNLMDGWARDCLRLFIGCVDNAGGRLAIHQYLENLNNGNLFWWLDCGNERSNGQVLLGNPEDEPEDLYNLPEYVNWFPSPAVQHPELVATDNVPQAPLDPSTRLGEPNNRENLSCAEMALQDAQGLVINQVIASHAADYILRLLVTKDLRKYATYIDMESGSVRSRYMVKDGE